MRIPGEIPGKSFWQLSVSRSIQGVRERVPNPNKFMVEQGMEVPNDAGVLGTNLWDAWKAGRIMRAPNGVYTPLDGSGKTEWDRPFTDYYYAAEQGFPTPGSWPPGGGHR